MDAAAKERLKIGKILKKPVQKMADFHRKSLILGENC